MAHLCACVLVVFALTPLDEILVVLAIGAVTRALKGERS